MAILWVAVAGLAPSFATVAAADESTGKMFCKRPFTADSSLHSPASGDLYNALLWMGGVGAIHFGANPESRWSDTNGFDRGIRSGLRIDSSSGRESAAIGSDVLLGMSMGLMPLAAIGKIWSEGRCREAYDMATDAMESLALTLFLTEATKVVAGRDRPFGQECDGTPPPDANCQGTDRLESFFSGHASTAAAGAGLSCAYSIKRRTWGNGTAARLVPCVLGVSLAVAAGVLRVASDQHWGTDVLVGWAVGATVGYFDTWGPFDLLRFEVETERHTFGVRGVVLPYAADGEFGARIAITF